MSDLLNTAKETLLKPAQITENHLQKTLGDMLSHQVDSADLYFQSTYHESWVLEDSRVKEGVFNVEKGVGVRAIAGEKTGFAYSDDVILPALEEASNAAKSIAKRGDNVAVKAWTPIQRTEVYSPVNPIESLETAKKIALLHQIDDYLRSTDPRVIHVNASLSGVYDVVLIAQSDGTLAADVRPLVRCNVSVIVEENGRRETGFAGGGGRCDYEMFMQASCVLGYAKEALRQALVNLEAIEAPAGVMPVVLGNGWPGVLLHEAVGHGLEGDFNRKGVSAFSGRLGEQVAAPGVTVVDDGSLPARRGSLNVDDEGTPTQRTVLIENGILKNYMQDKLNAKLMNMKPTGNCRRESYSHIPLPRMTNTFMLAGDKFPEEILSTVKKGIYAVQFGGGQVDITSGKFVFSATEAYLIENGKPTVPIKGATLIGNGPDVMTKVSMVGNDLALDTGIGVCGKEGQSVPVGVGQPTLKIDGITVGGTQ